MQSQTKTILLLSIAWLLDLLNINALGESFNVDEKNNSVHALFCQRRVIFDLSSFKNSEYSNLSHRIKNYFHESSRNFSYNYHGYIISKASSIVPLYVTLETNKNETIRCANISWSFPNVISELKEGETIVSEEAAFNRTYCDMEEGCGNSAIVLYVDTFEKDHMCCFLTASLANLTLHENQCIPRKCFNAKNNLKESIDGDQSLVFYELLSRLDFNVTSIRDIELQKLNHVNLFLLDVIFGRYIPLSPKEAISEFEESRCRLVRNYIGPLYFLYYFLLLLMFIWKTIYPKTQEVETRIYLDYGLLDYDVDENKNVLVPSRLFLDSFHSNMLRHYCLRPVNICGGYHTTCFFCDDGYCGPVGCQCSDCYKLDVPLPWITNIIKNFFSSIGRFLWILSLLLFFGWFNFGLLNFALIFCFSLIFFCLISILDLAFSNFYLTSLILLVAVFRIGLSASLLGLLAFSLFVFWCSSYLLKVLLKSMITFDAAMLFIIFLRYPLHRNCHQSEVGSFHDCLVVIILIFCLFMGDSTSIPMIPLYKSQSKNRDCYHSYLDKYKNKDETISYLCKRAECRKKLGPDVLYNDFISRNCGKYGEKCIDMFCIDKDFLKEKIFQIRVSIEEKLEIKMTETENLQRMNNDSLIDEGKLSQLRGVKIGFLLKFTKKYKCYDWTARRVVYDIIMPSTQAKRCRYVDLDYMKNDLNVGPAQTFISYAQAGKWGDLIAAICDGVEDFDRYVWLDVFAINQWPKVIVGSDLNFEGTIKYCTSFLCVSSYVEYVGKMDIEDIHARKIEDIPKDCREKIYFLRAWCLVECFAAIREKGMPLVVKCGRHIFDQNGLLHFENDWELLERLSHFTDVNKAEATVEEDKIMLSEKIEQNGGFETVNRAISGALAGSSGIAKYDSVGSIVQSAACGDKHCFNYVCSDLKEECLFAIVAGGYSTLLDKVLGHVQVERLNYKCKDTGDTALMYACKGGHTDCLRVLIEHRADVNMISKEKNTALIFAAAGGHIDCVRDLIANNANVTAKGSDGMTALMFAARGGHVSCLDELIANCVNYKDDNGWTALIWASSGGHAKFVNALLEKGANFDIKDENGRTAFMVAFARGHLDCAMVLISKRINVNERDSLGLTALMHAAQQGNSNCVLGALTNSDFNLNSKDNHGFTALMHAVQGDHHDCVKLLGCRTNVNTKNENGATALILASSTGRVTSIEFLLDNGADVNLQDIYGHNVLFYAIKSFNLPVMQILMRNQVLPWWYPVLEWIISRMLDIYNYCFYLKCGVFELFNLLKSIILETILALVVAFIFVFVSLAGFIQLFVNQIVCKDCSIDFKVSCSLILVSILLLVLFTFLFLIQYTIALYSPRLRISLSLKLKNFCKEYIGFIVIGAYWVSDRLYICFILHMATQTSVPVQASVLHVLIITSCLICVFLDICRISDELTKLLFCWRKISFEKSKTSMLLSAQSLITFLSASPFCLIMLLLNMSFISMLFDSVGYQTVQEVLAKGATFAQVMINDTDRQQRRVV